MRPNGYITGVRIFRVVLGMTAECQGHISANQHTHTFVTNKLLCHHFAFPFPFFFIIPGIKLICCSQTYFTHSIAINNNNNNLSFFYVNLVHCIATASLLSQFDCNNKTSLEQPLCDQTFTILLFPVYI